MNTAISTNKSLRGFELLYFMSVSPLQKGGTSATFLSKSTYPLHLTNVASQCPDPTYALAHNKRPHGPIRQYP
jgi:hypothetical protein